MKIPLLKTLLKIETTKANIILTETIPAPVGILNSKDKIIPTTKQIADIIADIIISPLKLLEIFLAINAGKIIKLDINKVPIIRIPKTTVIAVKKEIKN